LLKIVLKSKLKDSVKPNVPQLAAFNPITASLPLKIGTRVLMLTPVKPKAIT
jgi:hypothetical protein